MYKKADIQSFNNFFNSNLQDFLHLYLRGFEQISSSIDWRADLDQLQL